MKDIPHFLLILIALQTVTLAVFAIAIAKCLVRVMHLTTRLNQHREMIKQCYDLCISTQESVDHNNHRLKQLREDMEQLVELEEEGDEQEETKTDSAH